MAGEHLAIVRLHHGLQSRVAGSVLSVDRLPHQVGIRCFFRDQRYFFGLRPDGARAARFLLGTYASEPRENYAYVLEMELPSQDIISMEARKFEKHVSSPHQDEQ